MANFALFLPTLLNHEGGFVNHPSDPGGATKYGIILRNWQLWGRDMDKDGDIDVEDLKLITQDDAAEIYRTKFWDKINASLINSQDVANILFDFYVNAPSVAVSLIQHLLNIKFGNKLEVDGGAGKYTIAAINAVNPVALFNAYKEGRAKYYNYRAAKLPASDSLYPFFKSLGISPRPDQEVFLKGWLNRVYSFADLVKKKAS